MSWASRKQDIVNILTKYNYSELPDNLDIRSAYMTDRVYTLRANPNVSTGINHTTIATEGELTIAYVVASTDDYDNKFDEFILIIQELINNGFVPSNQPIYNVVDEDNTMVIATITFNIEQISC